MSSECVVGPQNMDEDQVVSVRPDTVSIFNILPEQETFCTSYDYYRKYPNFDEEIYYMLEVSSRENRDPQEVVKVCQEIHRQRTEELLYNFENKLKPGEVLVDLNELSYFDEKKDT